MSISVKNISIELVSHSQPNKIRFEHVYHALQQTARQLEAIPDKMYTNKPKKSRKLVCHYPSAYKAILKPLVDHYCKEHNCHEVVAYNFFRKTGFKTLAQQLRSNALNPLFTNRLPQQMAVTQLLKSNILTALLGLEEFKSYPTFPFEETALKEALKKDLSDYPKLHEQLLNITYNQKRGNKKGEKSEKVV